MAKRKAIKAVAAAASEQCERCRQKSEFICHGHCAPCWSAIGPAGRNEVVARLGLLCQVEPGVQCGLEMSAAEKLRLTGHLARST